MKIGFHTWEPGLTSESGKMASGGGSLWIRYLWDELLKQGHEIFWFGEGHPRDVAHADMPMLLTMDVMVVFWRWQMDPSYGERNAAYDRQSTIINACIDHGIPMLVHDQDHKITPLEILALQKPFYSVPIILAAPELKPRPGFRTLLFPNPYPTFSKPITPFKKETDLVYIGNNYERWPQFLEYLAVLPDFGMDVDVYGNWLEPGPGRQPPDEVRAEAPDVRFRGRISNDRVIEVLQTADATIQLAKDSYCQTGFLAMRWVEAAAAGILSFVPHEYQHVPLPYQNFQVQDAKDLCVAWFSMDEQGWLEAVEEQQQWVHEHFKIEPWIAMLKELKP